MGFFVEWLIRFALGKGAEKAVEKLFSSSLQARLRAVAQEWCEGLPSEAQLINVEGFFAGELKGLPTPAPPPRQVFDKLERNRVPSADDWTELFVWYWNSIREVQRDPVPFFEVDAARAESHLRCLAQRVVAECEKEPELFQGEMLERSDRQQRDMDKLRAGVSRIEQSLAPSATRAQDASSFKSALISAEPHAVQPGFHAEIDSAAAHIRSGDPNRAIVLLEELRKRSRDALSPRERYRLLANLGHAHESRDERGDLETAAQYYVDCGQHQPGDERARALEAAGYLILNQRERAFALAREIRDEHPNSALAAAVWLRAAPGDSHFAELEAAIPAHLRKDVEVCAALAWRALNGRAFDRAESYARAALAKERHSARLVELLGTVLVESMRSKAAEQMCARPHFSDVGPLEDAVTLLESALHGAGGHVGRELEKRIRYSLGWAYGLLGDAGKARNHLHAASEIDPADLDIAKRYGIALFEAGQLDSAVETVEAVRSRDQSGECTLLLAHFLTSRNATGDRERAIQYLREGLPKLALFQPWIRTESVATLCMLLADQGSHSEAAELIERLPPDTVSEPVKLAIHARVMRSAGDHTSARAYAEQAVERIDEKACPEESCLVALTLTALGMHADALAVWKRVVAPDHVGDDTYALLHCATESEDDGFLVGFCGKLRNSGIIDREVVHCELDTLAKYECIQESIAAIRAVLELCGEELLARELRVRLSSLGILAGDDTLVETDPNRLPSVEEVDPHLGLAVVQVLAYAAVPIAGIRYAYDLLRRNFDSEWAHKAMIMSFLYLSGRDAGIQEPDAVGVATAVQVLEEGGQARWYVIEDGANPDPGRNELSPDHGLAKLLLGKKKGDEISLRDDPIQERKLRIADLRDKFVYRFNVCMEEWEERFPETFFLWRFTAPKDEQGQPDLSAMLRSVDQRIHEIRKRDDAYRRMPLMSTATYASHAGIHALEAVLHLADQGLPIRCCDGTDQSIAAASAALDANQTVVLDATALSTLYVTDAYKHLRDLGLTLAVTSGSLLEFRTLLLEKSGSAREGGFLTKDGDRYLFLKTRKEDVALELAHMQGFLDQILEMAEVHDALPLMRLPRDRRQALSDVLGQPCAGSIALARERGYVLWTDDSLVAAFTTAEYGVPRVWTEAVFQRAYEKALVPIERRDDLVVRLVTLGYWYTRLWPETFLTAADHCNWDPDATELKALLRWLANPDTKAEGMFAIASRVLLKIARGNAPRFLCEALAFRLLDHIDQRPDGRRIIRRMYKQAERICGLDVLSVPRFEAVINGWRACRGI